MKKLILTASWFAVAVYCILAGVYGPAGLMMTAQANDSATAMLKNIDFLEKLNGDYFLGWNALRSDANLVAVQGRSLGFIASDETVVRVALPLMDDPPIFIGERIVYKPEASLPEARIRAVALYVWLGVLLTGLVYKLHNTRRRRSEGLRPIIKNQREMRVQEASRT